MNDSPPASLPSILDFTSQHAPSEQGGPVSVPPLHRLTAEVLGRTLFPVSEGHTGRWAHNREERELLSVASSVGYMMCYVYRVADRALRTQAWASRR